jgi:amidophosphoribosyltransferase
MEEEDKQQDVGCSGPMNGADDIGLFNSWTR